MELVLGIVFVVGYAGITLEQSLRVNKAASALVAGILCWTIYVLAGPEQTEAASRLGEHLVQIAGILFFLLGAMVIVETMDAHDSFEIVTERIRLTRKSTLLYVICTIGFFMSALLDNLTTTIVMITLMRKLVEAPEDRLIFAGMIVVAANAGGAWSPMGDVTTTMLWIGGQISAAGIVVSLFLPSLVCLAVPMLLLGRRLKGNVAAAAAAHSGHAPARERYLVFSLGVGVLLFVPVFKTITHLPPFMGMLLGLGVLWMLTERLHRRKDAGQRTQYSVAQALGRIDAPSILFFLGILLAVAALESAGILARAAGFLDNAVSNATARGMIIGVLSAVVDNVPLVAAVQGMYPLSQYPMDHYLWLLLAYCTGTGGSMLIIGSAAGVAAMGLERIDFFWYLRRVTWLALTGYLAGAAAFVLQSVFWP